MEKYTLNITPEMAREILDTKSENSAEEIEHLGENWIEGYKTGIVDTMIMLQIPESELRKLARTLEN